MVSNQSKRSKNTSNESRRARTILKETSSSALIQDRKIGKNKRDSSNRHARPLRLDQDEGKGEGND